MRWFWQRRNIPAPSLNGVDNGKIETREALRDSGDKLRDADRLERRARTARRRSDLLSEELRRAMGPP